MNKIYRSNKIADIKRYFFEKLEKKFSAKEANSLTNILIADLLNIEAHRIQLISDKKLNESEINDLESKTDRLLNHEPIQYVIGKAYFGDLELFVNSDTLIPRPETEEFLELIINKFDSNSKLNILDIGTGTACLPIGLKRKFSLSEVFACDFKDSILELAKINSKHNSADINFINLNILNKNEWNKIETKFDLIISNPPYVRESEKKLMDKNVLNFEPESALFVSDDNPLLFYDRISDFAIKKLKERGLLAFEINEFLGDELTELIESKAFVDAKILKDFRNKDRFLFAKFHE